MHKKSTFPRLIIVIETNDSFSITIEMPYRLIYIYTIIRSGENAGSSFMLENTIIFSRDHLVLSTVSIYIIIISYIIDI